MFGLNKFEEKALLVLRSNIRGMSLDDIATRATFTQMSNNAAVIRLAVEEALFGLRGGGFVDFTFEGWELTDAGYSMADRIRSAEAPR